MSQKKTGETAPALERMMVCEEDGLGFDTGCAQGAGVVNANADMVVDRGSGRSGGCKI